MCVSTTKLNVSLVLTITLIHIDNTVDVLQFIQFMYLDTVKTSTDSNWSLNDTKTDSKLQRPLIRHYPHLWWAMFIYYDAVLAELEIRIRNWHFL